MATQMAEKAIDMVAGEPERDAGERERIAPTKAAAGDKPAVAIPPTKGGEIKGEVGASGQRRRT
jgi:hypothetical protein